MKPYLIIIVFLSLLACNNNNQNLATTNTNDNTISFEKSDYGLIFTNISVNGAAVKAMIRLWRSKCFATFVKVL